jgi:uncharacterized membrane protein
LTFVVVFGFARDAGLALAVTATEAVAKIALYYLHERVWSRYQYGMRGGEEKAPEDLGL